MEEKIEEVIASGRVPVEGPVEEKRTVQDRPNHMIEMADKGLPSVEVRIFKDRGEIVELKIARPGIYIYHSRDDQAGGQQGVPGNFRKVHC
jgi:hypothetical protein